LQVICFPEFLQIYKCLALVLALILDLGLVINQDIDLTQNINIVLGILALAHALILTSVVVSERNGEAKVKIDRDTERKGEAKIDQDTEMKGEAKIDWTERNGKATIYLNTPVLLQLLLAKFSPRNLVRK